MNERTSDSGQAASGEEMLSLLRAALKSQYHAALTMLRDAIEKCPDDLWTSGQYTNPFWRVAYHALYFTDFYLQPSAEAFRPWEQHQTGIQFLDDRPPPPSFGSLGELPHRPPRTGEPYSKAEALAYWDACARSVDDAVDRLDLTSSDSGFPWYPTSKLEHQIANVRHLQHHVAQLGDRIRTAADVGIAWVGRGRA